MAGAEKVEMVKVVDNKKGRAEGKFDTEKNSNVQDNSEMYIVNQTISTVSDKGISQSAQQEGTGREQIKPNSPPISAMQPKREQFGFGNMGNPLNPPNTQNMGMLNDGKAPMNATVQIEKIISSEVLSKYGCRIMVGRSEPVYKEIPVSKYADGKWLYDIPGFVPYKDRKAITIYLNQTVMMFQGSMEYEVRKPGWKETANGFIYVTPQGVIGHAPVAIKSLYGQEFGRYENRQDVGRIHEFLNMENLTPNSPVATIICLYIISSFNYSLFKKAKIPIKFLLFLHGKRTTRKTSLVSAMTQLEHRRTARYTLRSTSAGLEAGFRIYKDAVMLADDLCPTQSTYEQRALQSNVELLTRSFGDGNGKQRNHDYSDNPNIEQYEAEGGAVITGEYITGVESSLSRSLFLLLREGDVDLNLLTMVQEDDTLLARFMWGFLDYITRTQAQVFSFISQRCKDYRNCLQSIYANGRYAEYHAQLQTASDLLLMYGEETRQITHNEAEQISQRHNAALQAVIRENDINLVKESPVTQLCNAIMTAIESGDYPIAGRYDNPDKPTRTILIDDTYFYIPQPLLKDIKAAYDRDNGKSSNSLSASAIYLGNLLADNGIITVFNEGGGKRNAKGIVIGGKKVRYIHVFKQRLQEHTAL